MNSNDKQRRYMEAIRSIASPGKEFLVKDVAAKHDVNRAFGAVARGLGWTASKGTGGKSGCKWVGPVPRSEEELFRMAHILTSGISDYFNGASKKSLAKKRKEDKELGVVRNRRKTMKHVSSQVSAVVDYDRLDSDVKAAIKPKKTTRSEVSVLWGLFTWKRS